MGLERLGCGGLGGGEGAQGEGFAEAGEQRDLPFYGRWTGTGWGFWAHVGPSGQLHNLVSAFPTGIRFEGPVCLLLFETWCVWCVCLGDF